MDERELLTDVREIYDAVTALDPRQFVFEGGGDSARQVVAKPLVELVLRAIERLQSIEEIGGGDDELFDDLDAAFGDTSFSPADKPPTAGGNDDLDVLLRRQLQDLCFTARFEMQRCLKDVRRHLEGEANEELLVACEACRRKMRRAMEAILTGSEQLGDGDPAGGAPAFVQSDGGLEAALAVRAMYLKFRHSLAPVEVEDQPSITRCLRFAAVSLAKMIGKDDFAEVRLADRALLLSLQTRILTWLRGGPPEEGVRLYKDVMTAADLLGAINMRQELQLHDGRVVHSLVAVLRASPTDDQLQRALQELATVRGRDEELDGLLVDIKQQGLASDSIGKLAAILGRLATSLAAPRAH